MTPEIRWTAAEIAEARGWKIAAVYSRIRQREALGLIPPRGERYKLRYTYDEIKIILRDLHLKKGRPFGEPGQDMNHEERVTLLRRKLLDDGMI